MYMGKIVNCCGYWPTHGWVFLIGLGFGLLSTVIHFNLAASIPASEALPTPETYDPPALQVD